MSSDVLASPSSRALLSDPLFATQFPFNINDVRDQINLSHERAKSIALGYSTCAMFLHSIELIHAQNSANMTWSN